MTELSDQEPVWGDSHRFRRACGGWRIDAVAGLTLTTGMGIAALGRWLAKRHAARGRQWAVPIKDKSPIAKRGEHAVDEQPQPGRVVSF